MRSKISHLEGSLAFDSNNGLIAKPHYPPLYHSLQITGQLTRETWSDLQANISHFILLVSSLLATFLILSRLKGLGCALMTLAIIVGLPLMTLHTGGSYADITLVCFAILSLLTFALFAHTSERIFLLQSGLFTAACVWTKAEGLFFCLLPWGALVTQYLWRHQQERSQLLYPVSFGILLSLLWPVYALLTGLPLTPHGQTDRALGFSVESVQAFSEALFVSGSFGVFWYGVFIILVLIFVSIRRDLVLLDRTYLPLLLWGLLTLGGYSAVYLLTSNADYLILGQSFDRQMLLPASQLTISCSLILTPPKT